MTIFELRMIYTTYRSILFTFLALILVSAATKAQPLPDGQESLSVSAQSFALEVPDQPDLVGGHLQGIQLHNGTLIVSGSSKQFGYLALYQLLGGEFKFLGIKKLATDALTHAGGFQVSSNWLAVGVEDPVGKRESVIQLIDVSSYESISGPPAYSLKRRGEFKRSTAGAVALLKRKDHFLLAVGGWDCTNIDLYRSNHLDPKKADFEFTLWTSWDSREAIKKGWISRSYGNYQNLQFSEDSTGLYLTGLGRTSNGSNQADVFKLMVNSDPYHLLKKVGTYSVQCTGSVTFRNGAGLTDFFGVPSIIAVGHDLYPKTQVQIFPIKQD